MSSNSNSDSKGSTSAASTTHDSSQTIALPTVPAVESAPTGELSLSKNGAESATATAPLPDEKSSMVTSQLSTYDVADPADLAEFLSRQRVLRDEAKKLIEAVQLVAAEDKLYHCINETIQLLNDSKTNPDQLWTTDTLPKWCTDNPFLWDIHVDYGELALLIGTNHAYARERVADVLALYPNHARANLCMAEIISDTVTQSYHLQLAMKSPELRLQAERCIGWLLYESLKATRREDVDGKILSLYDEIKKANSFILKSQLVEFGKILGKDNLTARQLIQEFLTHLKSSLALNYGPYDEKQMQIPKLYNSFILLRIPELSGLAKINFVNPTFDKHIMYADVQCLTTLGMASPLMPYATKPTKSKSGATTFVHCGKVLLPRMLSDVVGAMGYGYELMMFTRVGEDAEDSPWIANADWHVLKTMIDQIIQQDVDLLTRLVRGSGIFVGPFQLNSNSIEEKQLANDHDQSDDEASKPVWFMATTSYKWTCTPLTVMDISSLKGRVFPVMLTYVTDEEYQYVTQYTAGVEGRFVDLIDELTHANIGPVCVYGRDSLLKPDPLTSL